MKHGLCRGMWAGPVHTKTELVCTKCAQGALAGGSLQVPSRVDCLVMGRGGGWGGGGGGGAVLREKPEDPTKDVADIAAAS